MGVYSPEAHRITLSEHLRGLSLMQYQSWQIGFLLLHWTTKAASEHVLDSEESQVWAWGCVRPECMRDSGEAAQQHLINQQLVGLLAIPSSSSTAFFLLSDPISSCCPLSLFISHRVPLWSGTKHKWIINTGCPLIKSFHRQSHKSQKTQHKRIQWGRPGKIVTSCF